MKSGILAGTFAAVTLLAGCFGGTTTGPACHRVETRVTETRGDTVVMVNGLRYIDSVVGTGAAVPNCSAVQVHYTLFLLNGQEIESTQGTNPLPVQVGTRGTIVGFEQALVGMRTGGVRRAIVPPELGYGNNPPAGIPSNATLIFDLTLVGVQ